MALPIPLPRTCKITTPLMIGKDVEAHARAMHKYLNDGQLAAFHKQSNLMKRTFGTGKRTLAKKCAAKAELPEYGFVGLNLYAEMRHAGAYDAFEDTLLKEYMSPKMPSLVYPLDADWHTSTPSYIHQTGGIGGNYALDWMAQPNTPILAPESGKITRTSGNNPNTGLHGENKDVFGWSIYLRAKTGFYYGTHMGVLFVENGDNVKAGDVIGKVGDWPYDRGRSHLHLGFTSFTHLSFISKRKILSVASAPRVEGVYSSL